MGGVVEVAPTLTPEQITARLIEIGRTPLPNPHTVWVVEDPSPNGPFYKDRSELDNICYTLPVGHLEKFPFSTTRLVQANIAFYPYKYRQEALEDARGRLAHVVKPEVK